jgi:signal transduction histidine kinase
MCAAVRSRNAGGGSARGLWPVLLLLLAAVLVPTAAVLWFMAEAVRNTHLSMRQQLTDAYTPRLKQAADRLDEHWRRQAEGLVAGTGALTPAEAFARLVRDGVCDSAVIYARNGARLYPPPPADAPPTPPETEAWRAASRLEFGRSDFAAAAEAYAAIARSQPGSDLAARALQARARCLARAGDTDAAVAVLLDELSSPDYRDARDATGRLVRPGAQLMAVELMGGPGHPRYNEAVQAATRRLADYSEPLLQPAQRLFLMRRLREVAPDAPDLPALLAEELAARYIASGPVIPDRLGLHRTPLDGLWRFRSPEGTVVALFTEDSATQTVRTFLAAEADLVAPATVEAYPDGRLPDDPPPLVSVRTGQYLPGWDLALYLDNPDAWAEAAKGQVTAYLWTGFLVVAFICIASLLAGRYMLRQVKLTRLRNNFVATVTHELKTPLAGMRALVETLLAGRVRTPAQTTEYLQMIAHENERLSRLIDNFLSFSRMERSKRAFEFARTDPAEIIADAAESVRGRFQSARDRFSVDLAPGLPAVMADKDAMVTVLLNLLDNAHKYCQNDRDISLRAFADDATVCFAVHDNGIGLSRRAARKVFDRFYQVDQHLSRATGGCGLGLSIVKFIVDAHEGTVDVQSELGKGSTFTVRLPVAP